MAEDAAARDNTHVPATAVHHTAVHRGVPRSGLLLLEDGTLFEGQGFGAEGIATGLLSFHTAMSAFQEVLSDPASAGHIVTFTFPEVGVAGTNPEDMESAAVHAAGCVTGAAISAPSNFRSSARFDDWLRDMGRPGLAAVDTRAITRLVRDRGMVRALIAHDRGGHFDRQALAAQLAAAPRAVQPFADSQVLPWRQGSWRLGAGPETPETTPDVPPDAPHVLVVDFGARRTLAALLVDAGFRVTVAGAHAGPDGIARLQADGVDGFVLAGGPGDPDDIARQWAAPIRRLLESGKPLLGVGLGHQLLALAVGGAVEPMPAGRHGANVPIRRLADGRFEIATVNQDWKVRRGSLPADVPETHDCLFDHSLAGFALAGRPVFAMQHHPGGTPDPESPFHRFVASIGKAA